jgi:hypothetical protein
MAAFASTDIAAIRFAPTHVKRAMSLATKASVAMSMSESRLLVRAAAMHNRP